MQASRHRSRRRPNHYRPVYPRLSFWPSERAAGSVGIPVRWRGVVRASFLPVARSAPVDTSRIAAFPVFTDLPAAELDVLAAAMSEVEIEASGEVVTLDDYGTAIYFIEQGEAEVLTGGGEATQALGPGDTFGEIGLLLTGQRTATVLARTPMRLLSLSGQDFERIQARVPELERSLRRLGLERASR